MNWQITFYEFTSKFISNNLIATPTAFPNGLNLKQIELGLYKNYISIIYKQTGGKKLTDLLDTGHSCLFLISTALKRCLEDNNITGWKSYDIELLDKKNREINGYHGFSVIGRSGKKTYSNEHIIIKKLVPDGPDVTFYKGINLDLNEWDGSDIFIPKGQFGIYCTEHLAKILKKSRFTNISLTKISDIEVMEEIVKCNSIKKEDMLYFE